MFNDSRMSYPKYLMASLCCWDRLNQRMHSKLLLIDDAVGITGGRNYQDDYYDWSPEYDFRDRDVLVAGPVAGEMRPNFRSVLDLADQRAGRAPGRCRPPAPARRRAAAGARRLRRARRVTQLSNDAATSRASRRWRGAMPVAHVHFIADVPEKHRRRGNDTAENAASACATSSNRRRPKCCCKRPTWCCPKTRRRCSAACSARVRRRA
jgi:phosphatidylserine/phosphatidylglycerophosphate/cardiolipin synthase-like enzyme